MSLNDTERRRTSDELKSNLELSGLTFSEVAEDLDFSPERLQSGLDVGDAVDPVDIWQLRDYLEHAALDAGLRPAAYTVLTSRSRLAARMWFGLREAPRHVFTT
ncbi:MAG: DUF2316 family protein [Nakamurella sp.]